MLASTLLHRGSHRRALDRSRRPHSASGCVCPVYLTFPGHSYGRGRRNQAAADEAAPCSGRRTRCAGRGVGRACAAADSTPTAALVAEAGLNEMRPAGVYVFNDAQQVELGTADWHAVALTARLPSSAATAAT